MASTIIPCTELNANDIKMYAPRPTNGGGKNVGMMNKRTNTGIRIQLPMMFTYGASDYDGNEAFSFGLQFPSDMSEGADPIYQNSLDKLTEFETFLKQKVFQNAKEWTQRPMKGLEMVDMIWSPMLKYPYKADKSDRDYTRSPTINVKIPRWEGKWTPEIYDEEGKCLFSDALKIGESPLPFITKGTHVVAVLQCGGIWIVSGKIGVTWKLVQAVVKQSSTSVTGRCLISLPEAEKKKFVSTPPDTDLNEDEDDDEAVPIKSISRLETEVVDTDDEDEPTSSSSSSSPSLKADDSLETEEELFTTPPPSKASKGRRSTKK